jgi:phosphatidylcholine synthase
MFPKVIPLPRKKDKPKKEKVRRREPRPASAPRRPPDGLTRALAWGVHAYTALGLVIAAAIAVLLVQGGPSAFHWSFVLMAVATFVDATDGTLARRVRVKEVLPGFDGRKLDDITDFLTYTSLPLLLVWRAHLLPAGTEWCLVFPLLASAYGFCQSDAKTDDGYFLGFPSLWNVVAFYLYVLQPPGWASVAIVTVLAALTFVPSRYLYPSMPGRLNTVHNYLAVVWVAMLGPVLWTMPDHAPGRLASLGGPTFRTLSWASLFFPVFYMAASWVVSVNHWRKRGR